MHIIQFRCSIIPISILTTIASSLVGWIQVKRYSELSASYILTAHEIGVIKEQASYVSSESDFSSFIRDAETAFSESIPNGLLDEWPTEN